MVRIKMLRGNEVVIISDGKSYTFDLGGRCTGEDVGNLVSYMEGAIELPLVSVLTSGDFVDLGVVIPGRQDLVRYKTSMDSMTLLSTLQMTHGFIKMLRRSGKSEDVRFNQLLFVYPQGFDVMNLMRTLHATEVMEV